MKISASPIIHPGDNLRLKTYFLMMALILLTACGKGKEMSSLNVRSTFAIDAANQDSLLTGYHRQTRKSFSKVFTGDEYLNLENGDWDFNVISWTKDAMGAMSGVMSCGRANIRLGNGEREVYISVAEANCPSFSSASYMNTNVFKNLFFYSCTAVASGMTSCAPTGKGQSYRVGIIPHKLSLAGNPAMDRGAIFQSPCIPLGTSPNVKVPVNSSMQINLLITSYETTDCTEGTNDKEFLMRQGANDITNKAAVGVGTTTTKVFLLHGATAGAVSVSAQSTTTTENTGSASASSYDITYPNTIWATTCTLSNYTNIIPQVVPCSCNASTGVCTANYKPVAHLNSVGSSFGFDFTVRVNGIDSNVERVTVNVSNVNDAPIFLATTVADTGSVGLPLAGSNSAAPTTFNVPIQDIDLDITCGNLTATSNTGTGTVGSGTISVGGTYPSCTVTIPANTSGQVIFNLMLDDTVATPVIQQYVFDFI